jgi:hypothetical protein
MNGQLGHKGLFVESTKGIKTFLLFNYGKAKHNTTMNFFVMASKAEAEPFVHKFDDADEADKGKVI